MMVTGASAGPNEKSAPLTGGKRELELGAEVGSAVMTEQLIVEVGVSIMIGVSAVLVEVGVVPALEEQALKINMPAIKKNGIHRIRFILQLPVIARSWSSTRWF